MKEESCGAVIYCNHEYLLLQYEAGHWGFPKGNREPGETRLEAALREIKEETGLKDLEITDFQETITYFYKREGNTIFKTVTYFLAESKTREVTISWEHTAFAWVPYEKALEKVTYENDKKVLQAAQSYRDQPGTAQQMRLTS
jgi:8-oxo-dGTP pyrophosphatase MutT (NUDIX family)